MITLLSHILFVFQWVDYDKLNILGINQMWVYYIVFTLIFIVFYTFIQPLIIWMIHKQATILLTYIVSSLLLIVSCLLIVLWPNLFVISSKNSSIASNFSIIKHVLLIVGTLGIMFAITKYIKYLFRLNN